MSFKASDGSLQPIGGMVDSGADFTLLPFSSGSLLGLDVEKGETIQLGGIGKGSLGAYLHTLEVRLNDHSLEMTVAVASVDDIDGKRLPVLLGRTDLFDKFDVTFRQKTGLTSFASDKKT